MGTLHYLVWSFWRSGRGLRCSTTYHWVRAAFGAGFLMVERTARRGRQVNGGTLGIRIGYGGADASYITAGTDVLRISEFFSWV